MSLNFIINKQKNTNEIIKDDILNSIQKKLHNQKENKIQKNSIKNSSKVSLVFKNTEDLVHLEDLYKNSIISLEQIKKTTEKNINSNNIKDINDINDSTDVNINNLLLKKNS